MVCEHCRYLRELVINVVAKTGGVDDSKGNADAIFFEFCARIGVKSNYIINSYKATYQR